MCDQNRLRETDDSDTDAQPNVSPINSDDLRILDDQNVQVCDAESLQLRIIEQVQQTIAKNQQDSSEECGEIPSNFRNLIVDSNQSTFIKYGLLTPFEVTNNAEKDVIHKNEQELSRKRPIRKEKVKKSQNDMELDGDYLPSESECTSDDESLDDSKHKHEKIKKRKMAEKDPEFKKQKSMEKCDDANDSDFEDRIRLHHAQFEALELKDLGDELEQSNSFHEIVNNVKVPYDCWHKLHNYQKTSLRWLSELHEMCVGGILADEMGLGKTIQTISFLRALSFSQLENQGFNFRGLGPVLLVCPATLIYQWLSEFRKWFPLCRVAIFHNSSTFRGRSSQLIQKIATPRRDGSVLITTYGTFTKKYEQLIHHVWHYIILDEGHKIRNPDAQVTIAVKKILTPHRLILSGSPLQNSLREFWSLIDFIYPGRVGNLQSFTDKFSIPITQGGYANATAVQVRTAYKCACVLRDAINAYMLRRLKSDVQTSLNLPTKTEQVLFCGLTPCQRSLYKQFLDSRQCERILSGKLDAFVGLMTLRKICNHPDLATGSNQKSADDDSDFGAACRSGKMQVLKSLLKMWKRQNQNVLLFSQSRQMLTLLEKFVIKEGYDYLRMDGSTPMKKRQTLVETFNKEKNIFIFLLTTRVGGIGVNLTGANRVVIYDPDWNPSTDIQARERAWRIGQERDVTIYRLLSSGTIEEKIYHRQIFKLFLSNRILVNPKQRRFFKTNELHELFTLGDEKVLEKNGTETASLFCHAAKNITKHNFFDKTENELRKNPKSHDSSAVVNHSAGHHTDDDDDDQVKALVDVHLSPTKIAELRQFARRMSRSLGKNAATTGEHEKSEEGASKSRHRMKIPYLDKKRHYKIKSEESEISSKKQDDYVLQKLLKNAGVISALQHDQIFTGEVADDRLVEDEANAIAARAAASIKRLRRSSTSNNKMPLFGQKIAYGFENKQNESKIRLKCDQSESLLDVIRRRKNRNLDFEVENPDNGSNPCEPATSESGERNKYDKLAQDIHTFLTLRNGQALTNEILQYFEGRVPAEDTLVFRSIMGNLCVFQKNSKIWKLREEYL